MNTKQSFCVPPVSSRVDCIIVVFPVSICSNQVFTLSHLKSCDLSIVPCKIIFEKHCNHFTDYIIMMSWFASMQASRFRVKLAFDCIHNTLWTNNNNALLVFPAHNQSDCFLPLSSSFMFLQWLCTESGRHGYNPDTIRAIPPDP